jgi:zinc protease
MPVGNCLMGHLDGKNSMALAYMNSAGVDQMFGYTVETWYGYAGWGCLDYFVEQPGRYSFNQAFMANQTALIHRLVTYFPELATADSDHPPAAAKITVSAAAKAAGLTAEDGLGLLYDRDVLAFYGDPAWQARMAKMDLAWDQKLTEKDGVWTFEIKPNFGAKTFEPINTNGSQRGGRPIIEYLPSRIKAARVLEGAELNPVITENFILIPNPRECQPGRPYRVVFRAAQAN